MLDRISSSPIGRRKFVQGSALATGAFFINSKFSMKMLNNEPASPFTTPWVQPLRFAAYAVPLPSFAQLDPLPIPEAHQRYEEFAPQHLYNMAITSSSCARILSSGSADAPRTRAPCPA